MSMENLNHIVEKFRQSEKIKSIAEYLNSPDKGHIALTGMSGSQTAFILGAIFLENPTPVVFIADNKEEALYFSNDLDVVLKQKQNWFFPDSFKRPTVFEEIYNTNVLQRTEAVNQITSGLNAGEILVTYPEALYEMVVSPEVINETRILVGINEKLDTNFVIEVLIEYGFAKVDFVYEPGQFSVRGGIVDIFSFGNEWPYRIELFDDEVESIRTFDPESQLSIRKISKVKIVPNINTQFLKDQKVSLFDALPKNTVVWINDVSNLLEKLSVCEEKTEHYTKTLAKVTDDEHLKNVLNERAFVNGVDTIEKMQAHQIVFCGNQQNNIEVAVNYEFVGRPQPNFNKNFKILIENLQANQNADITNFIFTENAKQVERFAAIFEDLQAKVAFHPIINGISQGFFDLELRIACYTDHQIFQRFHRYKARKGFSRDLAMNIRVLRDLQPGDYVTHIDHGVGRYSGLEKLEVNGKVQESLRLIYKNNDVLYVSINTLHKISKFTGKDGNEPTLSKLGSDTWKNLKSKAKSKIKDIAQELIKLYAMRKSSAGHAFQPDGFLQNELEASFVYEDTPDQYTATIAVKEDMQKDYPMDRLICGDVGFGKTEVAIRAAFKAVTDGKQVVVLVPTTILALQHAKTFKERLGEFGVIVDYINRFRTTKEKNEIFKKVESGEIEILIGTHAVLNKSIKFKDLGLLIIDEEQKFGVAAKEKIRGMKVNVDTLTLTATPIPRTLQFSLMAARDLSIIRTPPPNRYPIQTEVRTFNESVVQEAIQYEIDRGGQVFFVHNRVKSLEEMGTMIKNLCPDAKVAVAHGQMDANKLEETLVGFIEGRFDVLVSTNIIETGLDIPNANTMIIHNAHHYGLSDLHQLRGRVGRSSRKAYCYLFCPPLTSLTEEARKRLKTLEEFSDLGSGFEIAMRDLDIRGAGNLLGAEQSGFVFDIGYITYQKILEEAILELKENEFKTVFEEENKKRNHADYVRDVTIDTDTEMLIPDSYISSIQERLHLYTRLDNIQSEDELQKFKNDMEDRFGRVPKQVEELYVGLQLRWIAKQIGIERVIFKNHVAKMFFVSNPQSGFYELPFFRNLLKVLSVNGKELGFEMKATGSTLIMTLKNAKSLDAVRNSLIVLNKAVEERGGL